MNKPEHWNTENLVAVHKADDEVQARLLVSHLRDNGIESTHRDAPSVPPLDTAEHLARAEKTGSIYVLEHDAARARDLVREFLASQPDEAALEQTAAQKPHANKEAIRELRAALQEERRTFDFLGWLLVVFLGAMALLWFLWPDWLKTQAPAGAVRWVMSILLVLAAVFAGSRASQRMK